MHQDGVDVAFEVVDGDERFAEGEGEGLGEGDADEEGPGEAGAGGDGDGVQVRVGERLPCRRTGALEGLADDGDDGAEVLAAGELGDDTAVVGVDELGGDDVGEKFLAVAEDGCGGLVAGGFYAEDESASH